MTTQLTIILSFPVFTSDHYEQCGLRRRIPLSIVQASINNSSVDLSFHISTVANHLQLTATILAQTHQPQ
jgi:hypothetical protein